MKLLILHSPVIPSHLAPDVPLSTLFLNTLGLCSSLNMTDLVPCRYKSAIKMIVLYISIFTFFNSKWKTKGSGPNGGKQFLHLVSTLVLHAGSCDLVVLLPNIWTLPHFLRMYQLCLCCIFVPYSVCSQDLNMYLVFWFLFSSNVSCLSSKLCFLNTELPVAHWTNWLMPSNRNCSFPGLSCTLCMWLQQVLLLHCHHCYIQLLYTVTANVCW